MPAKIPPSNPYAPARPGETRVPVVANSSNPMARNAKAKRNALTRVKETAAAAVASVEEAAKKKIATMRKSREKAIEKATAEAGTYSAHKQPALGSHGYLMQQGEQTASQMAGYAADALIPYRALGGVIRPSLFKFGLEAILMAATSGGYTVFFRQMAFGTFGHLTSCALRGLHNWLAGPDGGHDGMAGTDGTGNGKTDF